MYPQTTIQCIGNRLMIDTGDIRQTILLSGTGRSGTTWVEEIINWDNSYRIIFEPFSVRKLDILKHWESKQYLRPGNNDPRFIEPVRAILSGRVEFDKHVFLWCIENFITMSQLRQGEVLVVFYGNLCLDPEGQIPRIMAHVDRPYAREILPKSLRPSAFARRHSAVVSGKDPVYSWKRKIAREQIGRAMDILGLFRLDRLHGVDGLPLLSEEQALASLPGGIR